MHVWNCIFWPLSSPLKNFFDDVDIKWKTPQIILYSSFNIEWRSEIYSTNRLRKKGSFWKWALLPLVFVKSWPARQDKEWDRQAQDIEELGKQVTSISQLTDVIHEQVADSSLWVLLIITYTKSWRVWRSLQQLSGGLDQANNNIEMISRRTRRMVENAGGPRYCCLILTLSAIALVLLLLVIYT